MKKKSREFTENEVKIALNQLVEAGELHLILNKKSEAFYIENTFRAGYQYAHKEMDEDLAII